MAPLPGTMAEHDCFLQQEARMVDQIAGSMKEECDGEMDLDVHDEQEMANLEAVLEAIRKIKC